MLDLVYIVVTVYKEFNMFEILESRILGSASPTAGANPNLLGDANNDNKVDLSDFDVWFKTVGSNSPLADFDNSGIVDLADFDIWYKNTGMVYIPPVSYDWHTENINGVLNVWAPNPTDIGQTWTVDASNPLVALYGSDLKPDLASIRQGQIADCWLLAAVGSLSVSRPDKIKDAIAWDGNGWQVTFTNIYSSSQLSVHISNEFSVGLQNQTGEVWWLVMEKAFVSVRRQSFGWSMFTIPSDNTFNSLGWGNPTEMTNALNYQLNFIGSPTESTITKALNNNQPVLLLTSSSAPTMVQSHVYVLLPNNTDYNPWGFYETFRDYNDWKQNGWFYIGV